MVKTEKLFYQDPYLTDFTATVIDLSPNGVVLDRTNFYPQGGYQESDSGTLRVGQETLDVVKVTDEDGVVYHQIGSDYKIYINDRVEGVIDREKRWYLSVLHTTQHILSRIIFNKYKLHTMRSDFSMKGGMILFSTNFRNEWIEEIEEEFHRIVRKEAPVERLISGDDIRIKVGEIDNSPCGGTHVSNTSDLSSVYLLGTDKGKLLFDGGHFGLLRLRTSSRKFYRIEKMFNFPEDVLTTVERTIDNYNSISSSLDDFRKEFLLRAFKDDSLSRRINDITVSVIVNNDLDSKVIKKTLKMKGVTYCSDMYIIGIGSKLIVLSMSDKVNTLELCQSVINSGSSITGGGNRKRTDMSFEGLDINDVIEMVLSNVR